MTVHGLGQLAGAGLLAAAGIFATATAASAQKPIEISNEARFQFDFQVPAAALAAVLPQGFTSDVQTSGPAKDCNLRVVFIDRVTINAPDNNPVGKGTSQYAYLVAPVKDRAGVSSQLVIGGLTADPADAPGPFGNYLPATTHSMSRSTTPPPDGKGPQIESQDWVFRAATGEFLELHIKYQRGIANLRPQMDRKFYSAKDPNIYQISREEQVLDILRNLATNPPDHVKEYTLKVGGGSFAKLLDGTQKVLSWDNILWINRTVLVP